MTIAPIPTRYAGYHFRSRLEARWAVVFDYLGLEWEYEYEGYALPSGWYLPDFWVPKPGIWVEIKPAPINEDPRWRELVQTTEHDLFVFYGTPGDSSLRGYVTKGASGNVYDFSLGGGYPLCESGFGTSKVNSHIVAAYNAARSARFEHGQSGA